MANETMDSDGREHPEGAEVVVRWPDAAGVCVRRGTVLRHGRDRGGIYTVVRFHDDGSEEECHRSMIWDPAMYEVAIERVRLGLDPAAGKPYCKRCGHPPHKYGAFLRHGTCWCRNHPGVPAANGVRARATGEG